MSADPIQSMTGSGSATGATSLGEVTVECRSVNGRGLSVKTRFQGECQGLEAASEAYLRSRVTRGSVLMAMAVTESAAAPEVAIDDALADAVAARLGDLATRIGTDYTLRDVLTFPGVVPNQGKTSNRMSRELPAEVAALLTAAVEELIARRVEEGATTVAAMCAEIDRVEQELAAVAEQAPQIIAAYREKILARVNEFLEGRATTMDDNDVIREVALFADRVDIAEEQQRLAAHMQKARELLAGEGAVGRQLEFLVQEMLREVNTLGSKTPDASVAHRVVEMKSCIDRLKEQAANLS